MKLPDARKLRKLDTKTLRVLPPGTFTTYWQLFHAKQEESPDPVRASKKFFNQVPRQYFS